MPRRPWRTMLVVAVPLAVAAAVAWLALPRGHGSRITVTGGGRSAHVAAGTSLAEAARLLGLQPGRGDLLDVEGDVLERGAVPGALLLDGRASPPATQVRDGDRIAVANGADRTERLVETVAHASGGIPGDPQFTLSRRTGSLLVTRGALSHKLVSVKLEPASGGSVTVERAVALTFDDGPSPQYTPRVLAVLRRLRVPATFFVVGYLAAQYPELVRRELAAGMTVGNHSYNHPEVPPFDDLPARLVEDEIALGAAPLAALGARPRLFRPPGGSFSPAVVRAAEALGERLVLWSVDPADWQAGARPGQIARSVLRAVRPGSIVILHDGGGDRSATVAALPAIVRGIRRRGLRLVAISAS